MTRIAILSDIHANFEALKAVLTDLDGQGADEVYSLGDQVGYGPQPAECVELLREHGVECLMGNHEQGLINIHYLKSFNQPAADALRRTREMISEEQFQWLITRHKTVTVHGCRMVHGCPPDVVAEYLWRHKDDMGSLFARYSEPVCFVGHTHELAHYSWADGACETLDMHEGETTLDPGRRHLVNIGAVGQPRDGNNAAKYVLYDPETRSLELRFVPYNIARTVELIRKHGLHRAFGDRLW